MLSLIEATGISRTFDTGGGQVAALSAADLRIDPGDRIAIVGPSGSGKSTLLNILAGLDDASSGVIAWPAIGVRGKLRPMSVGMIHQFSALVPTLTVAENVALPLRLGGRFVDDEAVATALDDVGLREFATRLPSELSGGQAQRVGIARTLAHSPKIILADEPTGQLDQVTGRATVTALLTRALPMAAVVVATHDPAVASRMNKIWSIQHGVLTTNDATMEVNP